VRPASVTKFAQASARLLSSATEADHLDYAEDLLRNLAQLVRLARFNDRFDEPTAFFEFRYRKEIERASYAGSLLRIVADAAFCETLVKRLPWTVAAALREISTQELHASDAEPFVRELGCQAIMRDDGMLAREVGYQGFGTAPILSESLFSSYFIIHKYNPFQPFLFTTRFVVTAQLLRRFNFAAEKALDAIIAERQIYHHYAAHSIESFYEALFMFRAAEIQKAVEWDHQLIVQMQASIDLSIKMAQNMLGAVSGRRYDLLYVSSPEAHQFDVLEVLTDIVYNALRGIANSFVGPNDKFWGAAMFTFMHAFPKHSEQPDGMDPFQQRLALKLVKKLSENLQGWYPAISRVLLACIGPYGQHRTQQNRTAFNILADAVYYQLRSLPVFAAANPSKLSDYLPNNVTLDTATSTMTHIYADGSQERTDLSALNLQPVLLTNEDLRRFRPTEGEAR